MNKPHNSFTLIELLVVIAIIGILSGVLIISMTSATNSANDARRKADINQIVGSLLLYNASSGSYPVSASCTIGNSCDSTVNVALGNSVNARDPKSGSYYSYWSDGTNFTVSTTMSNSTIYSYNSSSSLYGSATGVCGSAANTEQSSIPSTNLCTTGTASAVTGDGVPYSWTCDTTPCEATKTGWINSGFGFYIMKYEAKIQGNNNGTQTYSSSFVAESRASGTPWVTINQTQAASECTALGSGYHLITISEWTKVARSAESVSSNWNGTVMYRGHSDEVPANSLASDGADPYYGTGQSSPSEQRRTLTLANGQTIWDLAGNVYEWNAGTCTQGSGTGAWYNSGAWIEWDNANLSDYEKNTAGPSGNFTSANGVGRYYGCSGSAIVRSGCWINGGYAGVFMMSLFNSPGDSYNYIGFRCAK